MIQAPPTTNGGDKTPKTYDEAMSLALLWATGARSTWNMTRDMATSEETRIQALADSARADAAEVEKWCAVTRAFAACELLELAKNPPVITKSSAWAPEMTARINNFIMHLDDEQLTMLANIINRATTARS
jgi:hypothetical protein